MTSDLFYLYSKAYDKGLITESDYIDLLSELKLDASTINVILATENRHRREKRNERKRNDNALRGENLSNGQ